MRLAIGCAVVLSAALLSGCGNACDTVAHGVDSANNKASHCGATMTTFNNDNCQNNLHSCSQDDITRISNYGNCLDGLPDCTNDTKGSWEISRAGCLADLSGISLACLTTQN